MRPHRARDIGSADVLAALARVAPVTAIRGNNDTAAWARDLPETTEIECSGQRLLVLHDLKELTTEPRAAGISIVVAGHSHRPSHRVDAGVHYVNLGHASPLC